MSFLFCWALGEQCGLESLNDSCLEIPDQRHHSLITDCPIACSVSDSGSRGHLDTLNTRIIVNSSGYHRWLSPINFRSHCKIDVRKFPFDQQTCIVKFGSWTYDGTRLDINPEADSADLGKGIMFWNATVSCTYFL